MVKNAHRKTRSIQSETLKLIVENTIIVNLITFAALIYAIFKIFESNKKIKKFDKEIQDLNSTILILREKNENQESSFNDKIEGYQRIIDLKQSTMESVVRDKNQQIENLKNDRKLVLEDVKEFLGKDFQTTSHNVFDKANKKLFNQFENYFESKNELAKKDIEGLVNPINNTLGQLDKAHKDFAQTYQRDFSSIESLFGQTQKTMEQSILETSKLSTALKGSAKSVGRWGEEQLRRVLEMSGMTEHADFIEQDSLNDGSRPDVIIKLPGDRQIVIDSKSSLKDYVESEETTDPAIQKILLASHAKKIRAHMKGLSKKKYWDGLNNSVDMVVMFVPGENFLHAALKEDPQIFHDALNSKVLIAGPQNLFVTLKTMSMMWSKDKQSREASRIIEIGKELYRRVQTMTGHITTLGENIQKTGKSYNSLIGSMDRNFVPKVTELAEFFPELEQKKTSEPKLVENNVRDSSKIVPLRLEEDDDHDTK